MPDMHMRVTTYSVKRAVAGTKSAPNAISDSLQLRVTHADYDTTESKAPLINDRVDFTLKRKGALEFKVLLIIKKFTDVSIRRFPSVKTSMPDSIIKGVKTSFGRHFPYWIDTLSDMRVHLSPSIVVSTRPLTHITPNADSTNYVLMGRVRTNNVVTTNSIGANLCVLGTWNTSDLLVGTNDWTYGDSLQLRKQHVT